MESQWQNVPIDTKKINFRDFLEKRGIISCFAVIDPLPFNISKTNPFLQDFAYVFWSTEKQNRDFLCKRHWEYLHDAMKKDLTFIDLDSLQKERDALALSSVRENSTVLESVVESYLQWILMSMQVNEKRSVFNQRFTDEMQDLCTRYWFCIGTINFNNLDEIMKRFNIAFDLYIKKETKKGLIIMLDPSEEKEIIPL